MKSIAKYLLFFVLFCCGYFVSSQNFEISGILKDSLNNRVSYASVVASLINNDANIIGYTTSDEQGVYHLKINSKLKNDSIWVVFRHISHSTKRVKLKLVSQELDVILFPKKNQLEEVLVNSKKNLVVKGDTITYAVSGLKKVKDYTIEEVIDRIPGVTISENGQIKYKNKAISHFYINSVDLLEGRYNIATQGIPADAVKDIEILKNHNHARIDKGVTKSDDVAFNLNIKEDRSLIFGSVKGDFGLPLLTGSADATPILIRKNIQDIASIKVNNMGLSLESTGTILTKSNEDFSELKFEELNFLNPPNTSGFGLHQKSWLDNESLSLTNDALLNNRKDKLFKIGVSYSDNTTRMERQSNNIYFFGNDNTNVNRESVDNIRAKKYYLGLVQEINEKKLFLKNKATLNGESADGSSSLIQNNLPIEYRLNSTKLHFIDELEYKTTFANNIIDNGLILEYVNHKENSITAPSVFQNFVSSDFEPTQTTQNISVQQFNIGAFSSYKFVINKVNMGIKQRFNFKSETIETELKQQNQSQETNLLFPFVSDFNLNTFKSLTSVSLDYKWKHFTFVLKPELEFVNLSQVEVLDTSLSKKDDYIFFQPKFDIGYRFNQRWNIGYGIEHRTTISRFSELNNGLILSDFSTLSRNPNAVNVQRRLANDLYLGYNDVLTGFFLKNTTNIARSISDFTFVTLINDDGLIETDATQQPNRLLSFMNTTSLTKRFFQILSTDISYGYSVFESEQIFNGVRQANTNRSHSIRLELDLDNNTWYGFNYKGSYNLGSAEVDSFRTTNTFLNHNLELDFYTTEKSRVNLGFQSVFSSFSQSSITNINSLFNISFFYKPNKKLFLRAELRNILNQASFNSIFNNSNVISQSQFLLRPRQFTVGLNYSL